MIRTVARTMRIFLFSAMTRPMQNFLSYDDKFCIEFSRILLWVEIRFLLWLEARIGFLNICNQTLRCLGKFGKMRHPRVFQLHTSCVGKIVCRILLWVKQDATSSSFSATHFVRRKNREKTAAHIGRLFYYFGLCNFCSCLFARLVYAK